MLRNLTESIDMFFRVLKNVLLRPFRLLSSKISTAFSLSRATSAIPSTVGKLPLLVKRKPEKREDYFDWGRIYVAKSLVLIVTLVTVALVLLYVFFLHSLFTSWWWVKDMYALDADVSSYSGKVRLYYDEELTQLSFEGRLDEGAAAKYGEEYWENGRNKYKGNYSDGKYSGSGRLYLEDGGLLYEGTFENGEYNGAGKLYENGVVTSGEFKNGILQGSGVISKNDMVILTGTFTDGVAEGLCKQNYDDGTLHYSGSFSGGVPYGQALEYYQNGTLKYNGSFVAGEYNGEGTLYSESGKKIYSGSFELGLYSGSGTLYEDGQRVYTGEFEEGVFSGSGTLFDSDGTVTAGTFADGEISGAAVRTYPNAQKYEGGFSAGEPSGAGTLYDAAGKVIYTGSFLDGQLDYSSIIGADVAAVGELFPNALRSVYDDCFCLSDTSGFVLECSFASGDTSAAVKAAYSLPIGNVEREIQSADDISAQSAAVVKRESALPEKASLLGLSAQDALCYAVQYEKAEVCYWTDESGKLLMISAYEFSESNSTIGGEIYEEQKSDEIEKLFEELGLDIKDFESLGF